MKLLLVLLLQNIKCGKLKVSEPENNMVWLKLRNSETINRTFSFRQRQKANWNIYEKFLTKYQTT